MEYDGMAYIKLYEDSSCKKELTRGMYDYYTLKLRIPTGNAYGYKKTLYAKNVGSHKAYNVNVLETQDSSNKAVIIMSKNILAPNEKCLIKISINFEKEEVGQYALGFDVLFDNIP